jgi:transposase
MAIFMTKEMFGSSNCLVQAIDTHKGPIIVVDNKHILSGRTFMRFLKAQHQFYIGIDLHARTMYVCVMDNTGAVVYHKNMPSTPASLDHVIGKFGTDVVIGVECIFTWYWIADFCSERSIPFALGHALYMKAIHGGKSKNDRIDSEKIAAMLRGGMFPIAHVYPKEMRATRDLLRRREYFVRHQAELYAHIENTNYQYNCNTVLAKTKMKSAAYRNTLPDSFQDPLAQKSIHADMFLADAFHTLIRDIETQIHTQARCHDPVSLELLKSIPGIGDTLSLTILYEIQDIQRFPAVGNFLSYSRLVKPAHESAGKRVSGGNNKIGNGHLKWAFSEAAVCFLRKHEQAQRLHQKLVSRYGKAKALSLIAQKLGRTVYFMLKHKEPYDAVKFFMDGTYDHGT